MREQPLARPARVVIVGAGFAGVQAARRLARLAGHSAEGTLINPTDYFLYLPLLPEVTAGILDPRRVAVPLRTACPGARLQLGTVDRVDLAGNPTFRELLARARGLRSRKPRPWW